MDYIEQYQTECQERVRSYSSNKNLKQSADAFVRASIRSKYFYNFSWLGRPVIQFPQDLVALQEIIWKVKPDLIIEMGIAHGGSLIFSASMLEMLGGEGNVLGVDIDIREHNRKEIESHPMFKRITMLEGSSVDEGICNKVSKFAKGKGSVMVVLDSYHAGNHVLKELELYAPLVTPGSYCVVFDTYIEDFLDEFNEIYDYERWDDNNPRSAVKKFLGTNKTFEVDKEIEDKLIITAASGGYLKRVR
jgi:cephalosporin hydroxylase